MDNQTDGKMKILVVDDEASIARMLADYLIKMEFDVVTAIGGRKALEIITSGVKINLILLDMKMPEVDGFQVLKEMEKQGIKIPVIILTGAIDAAKYSDALRELGYVPENDIVNKPVDLFMLLKTVTQKLKTAAI